MQVKIGDRIYSAADGPIMVIVNDGEKRQIAEMPGTKYAQAPDDYDAEALREWMR